MILGGPNRYFDPQAFIVPLSGTYGNAGRNILEGPGLRNVDLSLSKRFDLGENLKLQFRAEFFNAFNTPQFAIPGGTFGTGTFGRVTGVQIDSRQIQLALKYSF